MPSASRPRGGRFAWCVALLVGGCALEQPASVAPVAYDLGPAPPYARANPRIAATLLIPPVSAPAALDEDAIVYRLLYEDASRPRSYAMSRWSAEPSALVTARLRSRFAAVAKAAVAPEDRVRSDYTLRVELEDFSQSFDSPEKSRVVLRARATLLATASRALVAQQRFAIEKPAPPNAAGAVRTLTAAADAFVDALARWTVQNVGPRGEKQ